MAGIGIGIGNVYWVWLYQVTGMEPDQGERVMQTQGVVRAMNPSRGMVAIRVEEQGGYTIIEMLSSHEIELGDQISWTDGYTMGSCQYRNLTKGWVAEVYVQNHDVSVHSLKQQLLA